MPWGLSYPKDQVAMRSTEQVVGAAGVEAGDGDLALEVEAAARELFGAGGMEDTLAKVVELAVVTVDGCDLAGVFLFDGDVIATPAHTDPLVAELDACQQEYGGGPCLDALRDMLSFYAEDLSDDPRWTRFGPEAASKGVRSLLAIPLRANGTIGALNLYGRYPKAFGVLDRAKAHLLAALAALAFVVARSHEDEERRAANLRTALISRELIGQAQGILMERERITAEQAFDILRRASQHLNIKLREVAQALVDTGEKPDTGPRDRMAAQRPAPEVSG